MSRRVSRRCWILALLAALFTGAWPESSADAQYAIRGRIATRGFVKRNDEEPSHLDGQKMLVEYDDNGKKFDLCFQATGTFPKCAEVKSHPDVKIGSPALACAGRANATACTTDLAWARSVAYTDAEILYATRRLIAYETDFFTIDPDEKVSDSVRSSCVIDQDRLPPGTNFDQIRTLTFVRCNTPNMNMNGHSRVWAPIAAADVEMINFGIYRGTKTDRLGYFEIPYQARVNQYEDFDINAVVTFAGFEPRGPSAKKFFLTAQAVSGYNFEPAQSFAGLIPLPNRLTDPAGSSGTLYANIPLEAAFLTAHLVLANPRADRSAVAVTGYPPTARTRYNHQPDQGQIGLLSEISTPDLRDTEIYVYRMSDGKLIGSRWGMAASEVASSRCNGNACMVASMLMRGPGSLYTNHSDTRYNAAANIPPVVGADGKIVTPGRFGIELDYGNGLSGGNLPFLREGDQAKIIAINRATGYMGTTLVKMRQSIAGPMEFVPADTREMVIAPVEIVLVPPNLKVSVTRQAKITRGATRSETPKEYVIGFEGSGLTSDQLIEIRTEWLDEDGSALPEDLPGFTGRLAMTTAAADGVTGEVIERPDGGVVMLSPRLPQPAAVNTANPTDEDRTGFFPIRSGKRPVIVRVPDGTNVDMNHFYVHVDAQPMTRTVDFTGRPAPAGPSFSVKKVCYATGAQGGGVACGGDASGTSAWVCYPCQGNGLDDGSGTQQGAGAGALAERPMNYVPFLTAKYDHAATLEARRKAGATNVPARYQWLYRPEMQFSLFSLDMQEVNLKNSDGSQRNVLEKETPSSLYSADSLLRTLYRLQAPSAPALIDVDGSRRELVLALGGTFVNAAYSEACEAGEPCLAESAELSILEARKRASAQDFLALRLLQKGDEANVLWEYGFADIRIYITHNGQTVSNIPIGASSQAHALLQPANPEQLEKVSWRIVEHADDVIVEIGATTGVITVPAESEQGFVTIEARVDEQLFTRVRVMVGCECEQCNQPGGCTLRVGSVDLTFHLGATQDGVSAGSLYIQQQALSADAYKRAAVQLSALGTAAEGVADKQGLRQVVSPSSFVQVEDLAGGGYELRFYPPHVKASDEKDPVTGLYPVSLPNEADPLDGALATWRVFDPGPAPSGAKRLRVRELREGGAVDKNHDYEWEEGTQSWTLSQGNGLRRETKSDRPAGDRLRVERTTVADSAGGVASVVERTYQTFEWGEEIVKEVRNPDGLEEARLTTLTTYYSEDPGDVGNYRQVRSRIEPDGNWVRYGYDDQRRVATELRPWLDGPADPQSALPSDGRVTQYSYAPVDSLDVANGGVLELQQIGFGQPRVITERVRGALVSLTYRSIRATSGGHEEIEERCPSPSSGFGDGSCLRTETRYHGENYGAANSGKVARVVHPDGRMDSYEYERGTTSGTAFTAGDGMAVRTVVTHGTVRSPGGVANKTTREVSIVDERGRSVRDERYIFADSGYVLVSWTDRYYGAQGLERTTQSTGEEARSSWGCCSENSSTDSRGIVTTYDRDDLQRVRSSTRAGVTTAYTYDAEGRELQATRSGGGLSLTTRRHYDAVGRLEWSSDEAGLVTRYAYALGGRITIVTRPGDFTEVTETYLDGQPKSVTGSAVVAQHYAYEVPGDGTRVTTVRTARPDSPMFERTTSDMLGRTIRIERPGFGPQSEVAENQYDEQGRLVRSTATGSAATLYEYDDLGDQVRSGLDVSGNGTLDRSSMDRITESSTQFVAADGAYWQESSQRVYVADTGPEKKTIGVSRTRLTGLGGGLVSEQLSIDLHGNETRSTVQINSGSATETRTVDTPDSNQNAVTVSVNGRIVSSTSATGLTTTYGYDGLGRRTTVTDPRTGPSETHYDAQGRVDYVKDAAGNPTSFGYEASTGRKNRETNALNKHSYFAYNARGQLIRTWGDVPYPVQYGYNDYGRRTELSTYRVEAGWSSPTWPEGASGDITRWHYQEATGLLLAKEDAAHKAVTYTYGPGGRLATRTWARKKPDGSPLVTRYGYDPATGELVGVDYNDDTPDVTYAYDRLGRQKTVTDAVGTRTFTYDPESLQLKSEKIDGLTPAELTREYDRTGLKGRLSGFALGNNYKVAYGHDSAGRLQSVAWTANGSSDTAVYSRVQGSELLAGYETQSGFASGYAYEPTRDLKTQVTNGFGGSVVSQYDYRYDAMGRRTSVENSGSAFRPTRFTSWGYDERNQVTASNRYTGSFTALPNPANEVTAQRRDNDYDPIGNRESALDQDGVASITYSANELNQYEQVGQQAPVYDEDGNLLNDGTRAPNTLKA